MRTDVAIEIQDKAVTAVKSTCPGITFKNSDFDGDWLTLSFDTFVTKLMVDAVAEALPGLKVMRHNERLFIR